MASGIEKNDVLLSQEVELSRRLQLLFDTQTKIRQAARRSQLRSDIIRLGHYTDRFSVLLDEKLFQLLSMLMDMFNCQAIYLFGRIPDDDLCYKLLASCGHQTELQDVHLPDTFHKTCQLFETSSEFPPFLREFCEQENLEKLMLVSTERRDYVLILGIQGQEVLSTEETFSMDDREVVQDGLNVLIGIILSNQATITLKDSPSQYFQMMESSNQPFLIASGLAPEIIFVNSALAGTLGYTVNELIDLFPDEIGRVLHKEERDKVLHAYRKNILQHRMKPRYELRAFRKDGVSCWLEIFARKIEYEGKPAIQAILVDITRLKQSEESYIRVEERIRTFLASVDDMVYFQSLDGAIYLLNDSPVSVTGYSLEDFEDDPFFWQRLMHPEDLDKALKFFTGNRDSHKSFEVKYRLRTRTGNYRWVESRKVAVINNEGKKIGYNCIDRDITERQLTENKLRLLLSAVEQIGEGVAMINLKDTILFVNKTASEMYGYDSDELVGMKYTVWTDNIHHELFDFSFKKAIETGKHSVELQHNRKDGTPFLAATELTAFKDDRGVTIGVIAIISDITERKLVEEQRLHDALHDSLTGIPNRALFIDRLNHVITVMQRQKNYKFSVCFLDLDRFKKINESLGHVVGDELIKECARRINRFLRPGDTCARFGGDEFAILLDDIKGMAEVTQIADEIIQEISLPFNIGEQEVFTTASIGIAMSRLDYDTADAYLRDAATAMNRAKIEGRARYITFDAHMRERAVSTLELEIDLRHALERNELQLYYQPVVELESGLLKGFESLIRWKHPRRGLIMPSRFIPLAEETGLILQIDRWVLKSACLKLREWELKNHGEFPLSLSVNISGIDFCQLEFIDYLKKTIQETGIEASHLHLEITESAIMENIDYATFVLLQVRKMGVKLNIDDFGTGYSSLSYLHNFKIDALKIDRSFVRRMNANNERNAIIHTIVTLAHNLDMIVTAEGVETAEQVGSLKDLRCDLAQGYFFSSPVHSSEADLMVAQGKHWNR